MQLRYFLAKTQVYAVFNTVIPRVSHMTAVSFCIFLISGTAELEDSEAKTRKMESMDK